MPRFPIPLYSPLEYVAAAFSLPLFSLIVAMLVFALAPSARRFLGRGPRSRIYKRTPAAAARYSSERGALGGGAIAVIIVFAAENVVRGYLLNLSDVVAWWEYATPVFTAFLSLSVVLWLIVFRGTIPPEQPVLSVSPRTWISFGPRTGIAMSIAAVCALFMTTVAAGLASSADSRGRYIHLEIPVPNEAIDALRPWFYGWAYGVPVIICLAALAITCGVTLQRNAARPFMRPDTVGAERAARVEIASSAVLITTAASLLALGGAFRLIASSGSISALVVQNGGESDSYEAMWRYAEFAIAAGWLAPLLEITAFLSLLAVAGRLFRTRAKGRAREENELATRSEAVK
ncbi:hypothetical protein [Mycetocola zhujimingii]|uniref:Uncharacterized protein n=1 Tax=Mycetocola zhujimingii TaxID=2079792 RepID=A0A2U1TE73_9MICO|nr:hypothetical protein [Mycetocola zhujimingii]PWC07166.1 hypothetical protein DF223_07750 [Mycetocola zhujimingii]